MMGATPSGRERIGLGVLVSGLVLAAVATWIGPGLGIWVFNTLHVFPALALIAFALGLVALRSGQDALEPALAAPPRWPSAVGVHLGVALLGFSASWLLRDNSRSGDFGRIIFDLREGVSLLKAEPLSPWMMGRMGALAELGGELSVSRLQFVLGIWAALGFVCLWRIALELTHARPRLRLWVFALLVATGSNALLLAHVETYTFSGVCMLAAMAWVLRHLRGAGPLWPAILAWSAACAFHMQVLVLAPAMLMVSKWGRGRDSTTQRQSTLAAWLAWLVSILAIQRLCAANPPPYPQHFGGSDASMLVPLDGWFETGHVLGVFNELFLLAPFAFPVLVAFGVGWNPQHFFTAPERIENATLSFSAACAGGWLVLLWTWNPDLGAWHDWDLFAGVGWPLAVWAAAVTLRLDDAGARRWLFGLSILALARSLPFVWANHLGPIDYLR